jgi:hypothetical protein
VEVGAFIEAMVAHPFHDMAWQEFEKTTCHDLLSTKPHDKAEREQIYMVFEGARAYITFLANIVKAKNEILKTRSIQDQQQSDDELTDWYADERQDLSITDDDYQF